MELTKQINLKVATIKAGNLSSPLTIQKSHQHCMLCGPQSLLGLKLDFYSNQQEVWAIAQGSIHQQGYQGILHGGFLAALLDAVILVALFT